MPKFGNKSFRILAWCPREESNLYFRIRNPTFYPLNYEGLNPLTLSVSAQFFHDLWRLPHQGSLGGPRFDFLWQMCIIKVAEPVRISAKTCEGDRCEDF